MFHSVVGKNGHLSKTEKQTSGNGILVAFHILLKPYPSGDLHEYKAQSWSKAHGKSRGERSLIIQEHNNVSTVIT